MRDRIEQPLAALVDRLREEFPELLAVYRFGGFGTEYERLAGDLDLAVYAGRGPRGPRVGLDGDAGSRVMHGGERVYRADEAARETFEDYAYSSHARLDEERRGIVQDIPRRGSVYG